MKRDTCRWKHSLQTAKMILAGVSEFNVNLRSHSKVHLALFCLLCLISVSAWSRPAASEIRSAFVRHELELEGTRLVKFLPAKFRGANSRDLAVSDNSTIYWLSLPNFDVYNITSTAAQGVSFGAVAAADINNDGRDDIITDEISTAQDQPTSRRLVWYECPSDPAKGPWPRHEVEEPRPMAAMADDPVTVSLKTENGALRAMLTLLGRRELVWYEIPADPVKRWTKRVIDAETPRAYSGISIADLNADGYTDVILPEYWYEAPPDPISGRWPRRKYANALLKGPEKERNTVLARTAVADLNNDGRLDIVALETGVDTGRLVWYEGPTNAIAGYWYEHQLTGDIYFAGVFAVTDVNGDKKPDVLVGESLSRKHKVGGERRYPRIIVFEWQAGKEPFKANVAYRGEREESVGIEAGAVLDVNGDGKPDIVSQGAMLREDKEKKLSFRDTLDWWENITGQKPPKDRR